MNKILPLFLLISSLSFGRGLLSGFCEQGGERVNTLGAQSTTLVQRSFSACTITVYLPGTLTLATLYSDDSSTPKANPFVASPAGYWYFYAGDSNYDIKISGAGILNPFYRYGTISTGAGSAITSLTGDVIATGPAAALATIQSNVVTFAKFQQIATDTIIGRSTAGTGNASALTILPTGVQNNITRVGTLVAGSIPYSLITGGPTVSVSSVFGRTGAIVSSNGDYTASQVTNIPGGTISSVTVQAALNELDAEKQAIGNYITSLTGDVTASGPGAAAATLATVNSNIGTCGDSTHVSQVTLDAKGRTTACSPIAISAGGGSVFTGSTATNPAHSATPIFSLADITVKSPVRIEPGIMTTNVTAVTVTNKSAGAKFSIAWTQDGMGGHTVTYGASATNGCQVTLTAGSTTTQFFEVGADGTTVNGTGCTSTDDTIVLPGATSGSITIVAPAVAGTGSTFTPVAGASNSIIPKDCNALNTGDVVKSISSTGVIGCLTPGGGGGTIALAQAPVLGSRSTAGTATSAITWGTGHLGIVAIYANGTTFTVTGVVGSNSGTWTKAKSQASGTFEVSIWYKANVTPGADTITATMTGTPVETYVTAAEYLGASTSSPLDSTAGAASPSGTTSLAVTGYLTTANANELLVVIGQACLSPGPPAALASQANFVSYFQSSWYLAGPAGVYQGSCYTGASVTIPIATAAFK